MRLLRALPALLLLLVCVPASARDLYWDSLSVKAHLEADGRLRVEETQSMVFTGDWNGGERKFNIRPRQGLDLESMTRVDPQTGAETPMAQGSLDDVDHWDWTDRNVLRWRSRNPSDPAFDHTNMRYVLRYSLTNILQRDGDLYVLDHDFAFAERDGMINRFQLELTLDPVWQPTGALQKSWTVDAIPPGKSFVLRVPLRYTGTGAPGADTGISPESRRMLGALGAIPLLLLAYALLREKMLGRFDPPEQEEITRAWLERNILRERPEVIGAMWDEAVGAPEVSALLARMVAEGRLRSSVRGDDMELEILTRKDLTEYEQALLDGLFFRGNETSTSKIRSHYKDSGFDPAAKLAPGLKKYAMERLPQGPVSKPSGILGWILFAAAVAAIVYAVRRDPTFNGVMGFVCVIGALILAGLSMIAPNSWRTHKARGIIAAILSMIPAGIVTGVVALLVWRSAAIGRPPFSPEVQLVLTILGIWVFAAATSALRSRESREAIAFLKMLGRTRDFFRDELKKERPALDDAWYPYVLAFGLGSDVDKWSRSFSGSSMSSSHDDRSWSSSSSSSSSSSVSGSRWTGGGGAFGGAGASGGWALAASGMAAGVAAPSSSSSGGSSSSSSGGSSGGGGGGGW